MLWHRFCLPTRGLPAGQPRDLSSRWLPMGKAMEGVVRDRPGKGARVGIVRVGELSARHDSWGNQVCGGRGTWNRGGGGVGKVLPTPSDQSSGHPKSKSTLRGSESPRSTNRGVVTSRRCVWNRRGYWGWTHGVRTLKKRGKTWF